MGGFPHKWPRRCSGSLKLVRSFVVAPNQVNVLVCFHSNKTFFYWSVWKLTRHWLVHGTFIMYCITHFLHILDILDYKIDMTDVTVNVSNKRRMTAIRNTSTNTYTITNTKYKDENWNFAVFITSCSSNRRPIQVRQPHRRPCKKVQESALLLWYQNKTGWKMKYSFVYLIASVITQRTNPARIASSVQPMALPLLKFSINTWRGEPTKIGSRHNITRNKNHKMVNPP